MAASASASPLVNVTSPSPDAQTPAQSVPQSPRVMSPTTAEGFGDSLVGSSKSSVEDSPSRNGSPDASRSRSPPAATSPDRSTNSLSQSREDAQRPSFPHQKTAERLRDLRETLASPPNSPFTQALHLSAGPKSPTSKANSRAASRATSRERGENTGASSPTSPSFANNPQVQKITKAAIPQSPRLSATRTSSMDIPGLIHSRRPSGLTEDEFGSKLVIVMVGLPARGKSFLVKKLTRYLSWLQYDTKVFNVGNRRREANTTQPSQSAIDRGKPARGQGQDAHFFDPNNKDAKSLRDQLAMDSLEELIDWLKAGGRVAIHDATNSTRARRRMITERLRREPNMKILFIESICTDPEVLERNMRLKLSGPDYRDMDPEAALADFKARVRNYEAAYETISDEEEEELDLQYVKLINVGKKVVANNIQGYVAGQVVFYFLNFNLADRQIWITRHGESVDNVRGRLGGEAGLSSSGRKYAHCLARFMDQQMKDFHQEMVQEHHQRLSIHSPPGSGLNTPSEDEGPEEKTLSVWTSMMRRTQETVDAMDVSKYDIKHMRFLDEINAGRFTGMPFADIEKRYPSEWSALQDQKLLYRYPGPGGESFFDVIHRVNPVIVEVERLQDHVLIVSHQAVIKVLLAYFLDLDMGRMTTLEVPLHTVFKLTPKPYGTEFQRFSYDADRDTFVDSAKSVFATGKPPGIKQVGGAGTPPIAQSSLTRA